MTIFKAGLVTLLGLALAGVTQAADVEKGKASYEVCAACHGKAGEGNKDLNAPRIAGMPAWYTISQVNNFKAGIRGGDAKDVYGAQMRPMAMTLVDDAAVANVAAFVATLSAPAAAVTLGGDAEKGKAGYAVCMACHGADGKGMEALNSPPLAGQHDWYLVRQISAYKAGLRGAHEKDTFGQQMRPMAMIIASDAAANDVAAYIATLD